MVPLNSEFVELSPVARNEVASQTPGGGLRSPAARPLLSEPLDLALPILLQRSPASPAEGGKQCVARAERLPWWNRLRESVWAPVALKAGGACVGLSCLALVGASALQQSPAGIAISSVGTEWVAGGAEESTSGSGAPAPPPALAQATAAHAPGGAEGPSDAAPAPCVDEPEKPAPPRGVTRDGRIILNVASAEEFTRLPGVGVRRAEQIVTLRERLGKFKRVTDLLRVKGIGPKSLRQLTPLVVLDPEVEPAAQAEEGSST